jgi:hypothetical protein
MAADHGLDEGAQQELGRVVEIVEASWYGAADPAPAALSGPARAVHAAIATTPPGLRGRLLPRSLTDGLGRRRIAAEDDDAAAARH